MIRRNWKLLLLTGIAGATLFVTLRFLGLLIFISSMYIYWLVWNFIEGPNYTWPEKAQTPIGIVLVIIWLGLYASQCFPFIGTGAGWCL